MHVHQRVQVLVNKYWWPPRPKPPTTYPRFDVYCIAPYMKWHVPVRTLYLHAEMRVSKPLAISTEKSESWTAAGVVRPDGRREPHGAVRLVCRIYGMVFMGMYSVYERKMRRPSGGRDPHWTKVASICQARDDRLGLLVASTTVGQLVTSTTSWFLVQLYSLPYKMRRGFKKLFNEVVKFAHFAFCHQIQLPGFWNDLQYELFLRIPSIRSGPPLMLLP